MSVIISKHPSRAAELLEYLSLIRYAAKYHRGVGWCVYDVKFRQKAAANKFIMRSIIDNQLWLKTFAVVPSPVRTLIKTLYVLGISISFKCECHIITQIQYTKNLNPGSFQLGTTVRSLKIVTTLKIGSKECRVCAFYLPRFKINLIKFINAQINCYCSIPSSGS